MNNLYDIYGKQNNNSGYNNIINEINNFKKSFHGNPKDEVQRLLNSGQMSQADFNRYRQTANQILSAFKRG